MVSHIRQHVRIDVEGQTYVIVSQELLNETQVYGKRTWVNLTLFYVVLSAVR